MKIIKLVCPICSNYFERDLYEYNRTLKKGRQILCSRKCNNKLASNNLGRKDKISVTCIQCDKSFLKRVCEIKRSKNNFCSRSCSAKYNNVHKNHGCRRSALEKFIENKIRENFKNLPLICNDKKAINSELDFYFPTLNLAIEINGILHYEPIYGKQKLTSIQNNDSKKLRLCDEHKIDLAVIAVIDKYISCKVKIKYWEIIKNLISDRINSG